MLALYKASIRRAIGLRRTWRQKVLPFGLLAVVSIPAAVNVGIGYATRNSPLEGFSFFSYREYVGVSSALLLFVAVCAPDVICPDRRQRVLPLIFARPLTGTRLRAGQARRHRQHRVRLLLPAPGPAVRRPDPGQQGRVDGRTSGTTPKSSGRCRWRWLALAAYYAALSLAVSSLTARRVVAGAAIFGVTIISSIVAAILHEADALGGRGPLFNVLALPLLVRDLIFEGHLHEESDLAGVAGAGALALAAYFAVLGPLGRGAAVALPVGGTVTPPLRSRPFVPDPDRGRLRGVGVLRAQGGPRRAVVLLRPGRHRAARAQRRGEDHADAGHHRAAVGLDRDRCGWPAATPAGTGRSTATSGSCRRTRPFPAGSHPATWPATGPPSTR